MLSPLKVTLKQTAKELRGVGEHQTGGKLEEPTDSMQPGKLVLSRVAGMLAPSSMPVSTCTDKACALSVFSQKHTSHGFVCSPVPSSASPLGAVTYIT